MKNIHILPTPNPSRLLSVTQEISKGQFKRFYYIRTEYNIYDGRPCVSPQDYDIYITSDEEIKEGWKGYAYKEDVEGKVFKHFYTTNEWYKDAKKIILTTDEDLIKDGVQSIDDKFLEWFIKNSSCQYAIVDKEKDEYKIFMPNISIEDKIIIPKEETFNSKKGLKELQLKDPNTCENYKEVGCVKDVCDCYTLVSKEETLEEFIIREGYPIGSQQEIWEDGVRNGAKWQKEQDKNKYSEKDIEEYAEYCTTHVLTTQIGNPYLSIKDWFKQIKKK